MLFMAPERHIENPAFGGLRKRRSRMIRESIETDRRGLLALYTQLGRMECRGKRAPWISFGMKL